MNTIERSPCGCPISRPKGDTENWIIRHDRCCEMWPAGQVDTVTNAQLAVLRAAFDPPQEHPGTCANEPWPDNAA